jgi:alpha-L-rhamnosidase
MIAARSLTTNRRREPIGIDSKTPEFAWTVNGEAAQAAFAIQVSNGEAFSSEDLIWDTGWIESGSPFGVLYGGQSLASRRKYHWRVRLRSRDAGESEWGPTATFETGIFSPSEWSASWITSDNRALDVNALYFRGAMEVGTTVIRARAYVSALGWYRFFVNGHNLTGSALVPRWTPFDSYVEYQTYDLTEHLVAGENVFGAIVAEGRFRGRLGLASIPARYGDSLAVIAQIVIDFSDGSQLVTGTDPSWIVGEGQITTADPKFGERVDGRISADDWIGPNGAPVGATRAVNLPRNARVLVAEEVERVDEVGRVSGIISRTPKGDQLVDFGQNFAGVARVRLSGAPGTVVTLSFSEVIGADGEIDTLYLEHRRKPAEWYQRDEIVLGETPFDYTPSFTIHGFRFMSISGLNETLAPEDVEGIVLSTDFESTADFHASDPRLEQLAENVTWSLRSNFTDTPTDCPTRERSGWTGDIQVFGPTASILVDADSYLRRYLRNLATDQREDGRVPPFIPSEHSSFKRVPGDALIDSFASSAGWGDVAVILPWTLHRYYGDVDVLRRQYDSASAWVDQLARRARTKRGLLRRITKPFSRNEKYIVDSGFHWGEWLRPGESAGKAMIGGFLSHYPVVSTAYLAHSARLLAEIARRIDRPGDAERYERLTGAVRQAWVKAFVTKDGARIGGDKQDDYVRALAFELLPPTMRARAADRLAELIHAADDHLGTGFLSTPMLLFVLSDNGYSDLAFRLLFQTSNPSWLGQIELGATTIWETWEGHDADGNATSSHNHYAFGSVAQWLHERVAGLAPTEPGYRRMKIAPLIGGGLTSASTRRQTPYGMASASWTTTGDHIDLQITVPLGTKADVFNGAQLVATAGPGTHRYTWTSDTGPVSL